MPEATENLAIKTLLEDNIITQDEYDILFCSKDDWFSVDNEGKQDWSISSDKLDEFWKSIKK